MDKKVNMSVVTITHRDEGSVCKHACPWDCDGEAANVFGLNSTLLLSCRGEGLAAEPAGSHHALQKAHVYTHTHYGVAISTLQ